MKNKRISKFFIILVFLSLFATQKLSALDNDVAHPTINKSIADKKLSFNNFSLHNYLKTQLELQNGVDTAFKGLMVSEWLGEGGKAEDYFGRMINHFYNPLTNKGLWTNFSAKDWAMRPIKSQYEDGQYSWNDARDYYFKALTSSDKGIREANFAETFRAIGQVMHLVQDMIVPAHVRPIEHPLNEPFENWVADNISNKLTVTPIYFNVNGQLLPPNIPALFDTEQYTIDNPDPAITLSSNIGLAEFTNANFLAETLWGLPDISSFPNPKLETMEPENDPITGEITIYWSKVLNPATGEKISHFVTERPYGKELRDGFSQYYNKYGIRMDGKVYTDYAQHLIPRAIGYSSALLNYFFRGQMEVKCLPVIKENKISYVKLTIINATLGEAMTNGKLMLTGKYMADNNEEIIFSAKYGTSDYADIALLEYGKPLDLSFLFPEGTQIPVDKWASVKLTLTYQGKLGSEEGAVIGKVFDPGKLSFNEEFNTAPKGDYNWFQMDTPVFGTNICPYHNMDHGVAQNEIVGGKLIKTNIRYPITNPSGLYPGSHLNTSLIGVHNLSGNTYANNTFPIPVTKDTYIEFKIDDMTISPNTAASGSYTHYQGMLLSFNNGYNLEFSLNNQYWYVNNTTGYFTFNAGYTILSNIHKMFAQRNLPVPDDFKLNYIGLFQQIGPDLPLDTQYEQR